MTKDPIAELISQLAKLPGVGEKTAARLAFHIIRQPDTYAEGLTSAIQRVKSEVRFCSICCHLTDLDPCRICTSPRRVRSQICVVESTPDLLAIDRTGEHQGLYHVLHGLIRPLEGVGPDDIRVKELMQRIASPADGVEVDEVIVATSPSTDGETTALYLAKLLRTFDVRVTRIASGVPIGSDLEYTDRATLGRAMAGRREF
jgi:recombination protein RecR